MDDLSAGAGRFFLVTGEPGIGKTRLCDELATPAARRGLTVLWGRAWEAGGAPAYWPWLEILSGLARRLEDADLTAALGDGAGLVAELVPEIRVRTPRSTLATPPTPEEARFQLWRAVVSLVRQAAGRGGLALIFDDLHSTDRSSLLLLYAVARELRSLPVLLLATCRDVEAHLDAESSALISRLGREGVTLGLPRLGRQAVDELVLRRAGAQSSAVQDKLFDSTQGNPLFVDEMLRLLQEEGGASILAGVVPAGVREVIRQRLERAREQSRELLELAAVAGDEVHPPLLAAAGGRDSAWVATHVAHALRAGVFVERAGRIRFSHALVREVLYRDLQVEARRTLHAAVGRALEHRGERDGGRDAATLPLMELAHHAIESVTDDLPRAVHFAVLAAARAVELTAPEEALEILLRVTRVLDAAGNPPQLQLRVLLALADTRIRSGEVVTGRALCCKAAALATQLGDPALLATAALTYGRVFTYAIVDPVMVRLLQQALAAQPPGDSTTRARLLARLAAALQPARTPEEPVRLAREAIATARRLGDRKALLETIHDGLSALMDIVEPRERLVLNLEVESLASALGDRERLLRTHVRLALDHLSLGEFVEADVRIDAFAALATELRASWILWRVPIFRAVRAATHGRFAEAERLEQEARVLAQAANDPQSERALLLHRECRLRTAELHDEMKALDPRTRQERSIFEDALALQNLSSAMVFTRLEDPERARFHLEAVPEELRPPMANVFALFLISESAAYVGTAVLAEKLYRLLAPSADQYVMLGMTHTQWEGPVARLLGLLAARLERWDQAVGHFEDAVARLRALDARPHLARAQYEFGRALLQRGRPEDLARARDLLTAAHRLAEEHGMVGLVNLAAGRLSGLPGAAGQGPGSDRTTGAPPTPHGDGSPPGVPGLAITLEGEYWSVTDGSGGTFRLKDSLGMKYLARLLAEPGREIHVLDLVTGGRAASGEDTAGDAIDSGDAGELLDQEARELYRRRLDDLQDSLSDAESMGDVARAARAREEIEFLAAELGRAVGLGGRARRGGSAAERARTAVQRRIKNALLRIGEASPALGRQLARTISTGNFCVYRPDQ